MRLRESQDSGSSLLKILSINLWLVIAMATSTVSRADAEAGKALYNQCAGCHAVGPGAAHRFGPHLNGLHARGAGMAQGYDYSQALVSKVAEGLSWDAQSLDAYLAAPMSYMPGTRMAYPGMPSAEDRSNVIAYLAQFNLDGSVAGEATAPAPARSEPIAQNRPLARDVAVPEHGVFHLGRPALEAEVRAWDIDIRPDGLGLPRGSGTVQLGGELYDAQCASCHGVFGEGEGRWPILAGGQDSLQEERPEKTIGSYWPYLSTVFDYVRRAMPFGNARSLSDDEVYALTAYLLYLNDIVDESFELSAGNFGTINMPNENNFIADTRAEEDWFDASTEPCMNHCLEGDAVVSMRARVLDVTPEGDTNE